MVGILLPSLLPTNGKHFSPRAFKGNLKRVGTIALRLAAFYDNVDPSALPQQVGNVNGS